MASEAFRSFFRSCRELTAKHKVITTALTVAGICATGDTLSQTFETYQDIKQARAQGLIPNSSDISIRSQVFHELKARYDFKRVSAAAAFGFCVSGPIGYLWYPTLDKFVKTKFPHFLPGSAKFVFTKVMLEQLIYGPVLTFLYFPVVSFFEGGDALRTLPERLKNDFWKTLLVDELAFTLIAPITYKFIPVHFQLIWTTSVSSIENMFFSWVQHQGFPALDLPGLPWGATMDNHQEKYHTDASADKVITIHALKEENNKKAPLHIFKSQ